MPYPKILFDIVHLFPTLLLTIMVVVILYFVFRNFKYRMLIVLASGIVIGFVLYFNSDAFLNSRRYYKTHKNELEKIVSLYKKTTENVAYNVWIGGDDNVNIGLFPDSTESFKIFSFYPATQFDSTSKDELLRKGNLTGNELDTLITLLVKTGCKELSKFPQGLTEKEYPNEPYAVCITYKHFPVGFSYFYGFSFCKNGYKLPGRDDFKIDSNIYFYRSRTSINGY